MVMFHFAMLVITSFFKYQTLDLKKLVVIFLSRGLLPCFILHMESPDPRIRRAYLGDEIQGAPEGKGGIDLGGCGCHG